MKFRGNRSMEGNSRAVSMHSVGVVRGETFRLGNILLGHLRSFRRYFEMSCLFILREGVCCDVAELTGVYT